MLVEVAGAAALNVENDSGSGHSRMEISNIIIVLLMGRKHEIVEEDPILKKNHRIEKRRKAKQQEREK